MDIDELIKISEEADKHSRRLGRIDPFDQISKRNSLIEESERQLRKINGLDFYKPDQVSQHNALIDDVERHLGKINSIDSYKIDQFAKKQALLDKATGLGAITYKDFINDRVLEIGKDLAQYAKVNTIASPIFDLVNEANHRVLNIVQDSLTKNFSKSLSSIADLEALAGVRAKDWLNFQERLAPKLEMDKFLGSHLLGITEKSLLAQSALINMDFDRIGLGLNVEKEIRNVYGNSFLDFSNSYKDLFKSYEVPQTSIFTLPPHLTELPTFEFLSGVDLAETTFEYNEEVEFQEERSIERDELQIIVTDSLETYLTSVNPDLHILRVGAKEAFSSNNPDKIRHCITSLRELVTQVMHFLSPDAEIKTWSQSKDDFDKGRPTRRARLRFIARHINHGEFTDFVEKDLAATLAAIQLFNAGTHKVKSNMTERQLQALITKVETTLLFLFEIGNSTEH